MKCSCFDPSERADLLTALGSYRDSLERELYEWEKLSQQWKETNAPEASEMVGTIGKLAQIYRKILDGVKELEKEIENAPLCGR